MSRRGWLLFVSMCVVWGVPYLLIRVAVRELTPATLVFARTAIASSLLLPLAAFRRELRPLLAAWRPLLGFAVIEIGVPWLLLNSAERRLTSSLTALLIGATPLVGAVTAMATRNDDRLDTRRAAGLLLGLAGVAAVVGLNVGSVDVPALLEVAGVAVAYAVGPIVLSRYLGHLPSLAVIAVSLGLCALAYAPLAALEHPAQVPSGRVLGSVAGLALLCTAVGFVVFFALIAEVGPARATVITYVNPAVAAVLGVALLSEPFTWGMGIGFALVLLGSYLATHRPRERIRLAPAAGEPN
jgi:drug/metabolite transporter (DMT)-like permease